MSLWKKHLTLVEINEISIHTAHTPLGIRYTELTETSLSGTMPVDERTRQPFGFLHGGASVLLAESLGSMAAHMACEEDEIALGIEINASHIAAVREGTVIGTATPIKIGRTIQTWGIELRDGRGRVTCVARLTVAIKAR